MMAIEWRDLPIRTLVSVTWFVVQVLLLVRIRSGVLVKSMSSFSWGCRVGAGRSNRRTWWEKGERVRVMKIYWFPLKEAADQMMKLITTTWTCTFSLWQQNHFYVLWVNILGIFQKRTQLQYCSQLPWDDQDVLASLRSITHSKKTDENKQSLSNHSTTYWRQM